MKFSALPYFLALSVFLAAGCGRIADIKGEEDKIQGLIRSYESGNWEIRRKTVEEISPYQSVEVEKLLLQATEDSHQLVRIEALKALKKRGNKKVKRAVKRLAEYERDSNVRWHALQTLAEFRDPTAAPVFVQGLGSTDSLIREESVRGLLLIDDFAIKYVSIPYILQALEDPSINVRLAALNHLSFQDERIYAAMTGMMDREALNRYTLLKALLKALEGYRLDSTTRKKISALLVHPNLEIRLLSYNVLKKDRELRRESR